MGIGTTEPLKTECVLAAENITCNIALNTHAVGNRGGTEENDFAALYKNISEASNDTRSAAQSGICQGLPLQPHKAKERHKRFKSKLSALIAVEGYPKQLEQRLVFLDQRLKKEKVVLQRFKIERL